MLMAVQLPDDFVIAVLEIEIWDVRPEDGGGPAVVDRIEMPIDVPSRAGESQILVTEHVVAAGENAVGAPRRVVGGVRPARENIRRERFPPTQGRAQKQSADASAG